jgi:hypothetical protein
VGVQVPWNLKTATRRGIHYLDNCLKDGGKVVSLTRQPSFTPGKIPHTHFFRGSVDPRAIVRQEKLGEMKKSSDLIGT